LFGYWSLVIGHCLVIACLPQAGILELGYFYQFKPLPLDLTDTGIVALAVTLRRFNLSYQAHPLLGAENTRRTTQRQVCPNSLVLILRLLIFSVKTYHLLRYHTRHNLQRFVTSIINADNIFKL
jgi:hypothetical protein